MRWFCWFRTIIFYLFFGAWTIVWCSWITMTVPLLPTRWRHPYAVAVYGVFVSYLCRFVCGVRWRVEGRKNIPDEPCVVASNHQSTWETAYLQTLFTPQATVLKKELFKLPFFGWALRTLKPIAIDRNDPREAMRQMNIQGSKALKNKLWVLVFPEGTRFNWPNLGRYTRGAATIASKAEVPILPVVHDAGRYWPNKKWLKIPGEIVVRIGPAIQTKGRTTKEVNDELEAWANANKISE